MPLSVKPLFNHGCFWNGDDKIKGALKEFAFMSLTYTLKGIKSGI